MMYNKYEKVLLVIIATVKLLNFYKITITIGISKDLLTKSGNKDKHFTGCFWILSHLNQIITHTAAVVELSDENEQRRSCGRDKRSQAAQH